MGNFCNPRNLPHRCSRCALEKVWRKIVTPTAAVSALWLAIGGVTIDYLDWVHHAHLRDLAESFTTIPAADLAQDVIWRLPATAIELAKPADRRTRNEVAELIRGFDGHHVGVTAGSVAPDV